MLYGSRDVRLEFQHVKVYQTFLEIFMFGRFTSTFAGCLVATSMAFAAVSAAIADDQEDKKPAPEATEPEEKSDGAKAVEEKLQSTLQGMNPANMAEKMDEIMKVSDELIHHPDATAGQKENARRLQLSLLFRAAGNDPERFTKPLEEKVAQLKAEAPDSQVVPLGAAYLLIVKDLSAEAAPADVMAKLKEYQKDYPKSPLGAQLYGYYSNQLFAYGDLKEAIKVNEAGMEAYGDNAQAKEMFEKMIEDLKTKGEMLGKPLEIAGPTLEGTEFTMDSLKGKVVLVDFWATWCGPCVGEMPNVQAVYDKLHDKGFEVVGISLDKDEAELRDFVKEHKVPWTQIFFKDQADQGWSNPLAKKYQVNAIPATYLLDREGNVVAIGARGEMLEKVVSRYLNQPKAPLAN
jgi:thiol-disulfide isomerase/thioredoxin